MENFSADANEGSRHMIYYYTLYAHLKNLEKFNVSVVSD